MTKIALRRCRDFIVSDGASLDDCKRFLTIGNNFLRNGERWNQWGHVLSAKKNDLQLRATVQLFVGPDSKARTYNVALGENPSPIHYDQSVGDFFGYYSKNKRGEFDGEVSELF